MLNKVGSNQNIRTGLESFRDGITHITDYVLELSGWTNHSSVMNDGKPKSGEPSIGTASGRIYTAEERFIGRVASIPAGAIVAGVGILGSLDKMGVL